MLLNLTEVRISESVPPPPPGISDDTSYSEFLMTTGLIIVALKAGTLRWTVSRRNQAAETSARLVLML